jgi:hypothetical protein
VKKVFLIIATAAILAASCFEDAATTPGRTYPKAASPADCLKCVEISFNQRDARLLNDVLSPAFVFHFHPYDVGYWPPGRNDYKIPETWPRAEFVAVACNMFKSAHSISAAIPTSGVGEPGAEETTYTANDIGVRMTVLLDGLSGYGVDGGHCNFAFERYDDGDGDKLWRLTDCWDKTGYYTDDQTAVIPVTLGRILAIYH